MVSVLIMEMFLAVSFLNYFHPQLGPSFPLINVQLFNHHFDLFAAVIATLSGLQQSLRRFQVCCRNASSFMHWWSSPLCASARSVAWRGWQDKRLCPRVSHLYGHHCVAWLAQSADCVLADCVSLGNILAFKLSGFVPGGVAPAVLCWKKKGC